MPEICRYLVKCMGHTMNQGGTADSILFVLDRKNCISVEDVFFAIAARFARQYCFRKNVPDIGVQSTVNLFKIVGRDKK